MSRPSPLSDDDAPRSGKGRWVEELSDWSADGMKAAFASVEEVPVKTCDVLLGCEEAVCWAIRLHGCLFYTACEQHCQLVAQEVMADICQSGLFVCNECGEVFKRQADVVRFWKI